VTIGRAEGSQISLTSTVADPADSLLTYVWTLLKDGVAYTPDSATDQPTFRFTPDDNGSYAVTLKVSDGTDRGFDRLTIDVDNVAPIIDTINAENVARLGRPFNLDGSLVDPGDDTWSGTVTYEDLGPAPSRRITLPLLFGSPTFTGSYVFPQPGDYQVTVNVEDSDGGRASQSFTVGVADVPAVIVAPTDGSTDVVEGGTTDTYSVVLATVPSEPKQCFGPQGPERWFQRHRHGHDPGRRRRRAPGDHRRRDPGAVGGHRQQQPREGSGRCGELRRLGQ
jgi:hypothetical protein